MDSPRPCPYPSVPNSNFCVFHMHPRIREYKFPTQQERQREYRKAVQATGFLQIFCSVLRNIDISDLSKFISPEIETHIGYSQIYGQLDIFDGDLEGNLVLDDCRIRSIDARYASFNSRVNIRRSLVENADFSKAEFGRRCVFMDVNFDKAIFISATFEGNVSFCEQLPDPLPMSAVEEQLGRNPCRFRKTPDFMGTTFKGGSIFAGVIFEEGANFFHAEFRSGTSFNKCHVNFGSHFEFVYFDKETDFTKTTLGLANFQKTHFNGPVSFEEAEFGNERAYLQEENIQSHINTEGFDVDSKSASNIIENSVFGAAIEAIPPQAALFNDCTVSDLMSFANSSAISTITMWNSKFEHLKLDFEFDEDLSSISLFGSELRGGILKVKEENTFYEVPNATIGDIRISTIDEIRAFDNIYIENTDFDGFNFFEYRDDLREVNWDIDGVVNDGKHIESENRETTYAKAKSGARIVGDTHAESNFFVKERRCRRENHRNETLNAKTTKNQFISAMNYTLNLLFDISCKYAESSSRVITLSFFSILAFSVIYHVLGVDLPYTLTIPLQYPVITTQTPLFNIELMRIDAQYVIFSVESFTAFLLGGGAEVTNPIIRSLAAIQSFIGAFLIGLFVATLVRSVER